MVTRFLVVLGLVGGLAACSPAPGPAAYGQAPNPAHVVYYGDGRTLCPLNGYPDDRCRRQQYYPSGQ